MWSEGWNGIGGMDTFCPSALIQEKKCESISKFATLKKEYYF